MATIIEWGGCAPRGIPDPRVILSAGAGSDGVAQETTAVCPKWSDRMKVVNGWCG